MSKALALGLVLATGCWSDAKKPPPEPQPHPVTAKPVTKDLVQPVRIEKQDNDAGDPGGEIGGVEGGVVGGPLPPPPPPPPPPPAPPMNVAPKTLEAIRIAGDVRITPDDMTKDAIVAAKKGHTVSAFKLCTAVDGSVTLISLLKSSGFPDYDQKIIDTVRATWLYKPFVVNGKAIPVCTAVTFIYTP